MTKNQHDMGHTDDSLPLMHTHYLSAPQRAYCDRNPTYARHFTCAKKLQQRIFDLRSRLGASLDDPNIDERALKKWREKIRHAEELFTDCEDSLASLAEALLARERFSVKCEVHEVDGRWDWALPTGPHLIPRHNGAVPQRLDGTRSGSPSLGRRVSARLSTLLPRRSLSGSKRLQKVRSGERSVTID